MNDDTLRGLYRQHLASRQVDRDQCPSIESLEALVDRSGMEADRLTTLDHVMACSACRHDFELIRAAADAARATVRPRIRFPLAVAAGLVLVAAGGLVWTFQRVNDDTIRGAPAEVTLALPNDGTTIGDSVGLAWHSVDGAFQYQVEVLEDDGNVRYRQITSDTTTTVPRDSLVPGKSYVWWVRADLAVNGERRSPLRRFSVKTP